MLKFNWAFTICDSYPYFVISTTKPNFYIHIFQGHIFSIMMNYMTCVVMQCMVNVSSRYIRWSYLHPTETAHHITLLSRCFAEEQIIYIKQNISSQVKTVAVFHSTKTNMPYTFYNYTKNVPLNYRIQSKLLQAKPDFM